MGRVSSHASTAKDLDCLRKWQEKVSAIWEVAYWGGPEKFYRKKFGAPPPYGFEDECLSQAVDYAPQKPEVEAMLRLGLDFPQPIQQINDLLKIVDARLEAVDSTFGSLEDHLFGPTPRGDDFYDAIRSLAKRIDAASSIIAERIGQRPAAGEWYHAPDEPRPDHFPFGPLTGTASKLNRCIGGKPNRNARQLHIKGRQGLLWIVQRDRTTYEVWFRTQGEIDTAKRHGEALKTPANPKKARRQ